MFDKQFEGRTLITTNRQIVGDVNVDAKTIAKIIDEVLPVHNDNVSEEKRLFQIYFNDSNSWTKTKETRQDINNKITVDDAWAISRTINGYCFGEPIKYVCRKTGAEEGLQSQVEELSQMLDYSHNQDSTIMATLCSSVCGLGYKLALPSNEEEYKTTGVPFVINPHFIDPTKAFVVYSSDIMHRPVIGVIIGRHYDKDGNDVGEEYTVWTKYHQYFFYNDGGELKPIPQTLVSTNKDGSKQRESVIGYPMFTNNVPLIEVERNPYRKGDWEIAIDLLQMKNNLMSNRADDVQQVVDYIMLLVNCEFENEDDKKNALKNRVFQLVVKDPKAPPELKFAQNPLDQTGVQLLAEYLDGIIEEVVGIPSRAERGGGGHDTGQAVIYRNGFRDLENNAGLIIPKMDKAETQFLSVCIAYAHTLHQLNKLKVSDVRNKFVRSLSDDPVSQATAYSTFKNAGMNDLDALIISHSGTDPSEVHKNNEKAQEKQPQQTQNQENQNKDLTNKEQA